MYYVSDKTGRFKERPHYKYKELDDECEKNIFNFLKKKYSKISFPISTEDLKIFIEKDVEELDCYSDLSVYGSDVEGVTEFFPGKKPIVRISIKLTENERYENRLRTTLTHEYGHVHFHSHLFNLNQEQDSLFHSSKPERLISKRENIINAPQTDWMEWQAGYVCGAILMPITKIKELTNNFLRTHNHFGPIAPISSKGSEIINTVSDTFKVSKDAARVRMLKLNILGNERGQSLF